MTKDELKKKHAEQLDITTYHLNEMLKAKQWYEEQYELWLRAKIQLKLVEEELYGSSTTNI